MDYETKLRQQAEALAAYDAGTPSLLPDDNRFKGRVEHHRWGQHVDRAMPFTCPVCARTAAAAKEVRL